jgi:hypothetical protein
MIAQFADALSDAGVADECIHDEAYFDASHVPDPAVVDAIRRRFVADDALAPVLSSLHRTLGERQADA